MIPQRLIEPSSTHWKMWTRTQRLVFSLVNGKNSVTYIAYLLWLSPTVVEHTLYELYQMQVLVLDSRSISSLAPSTQTQRLGNAQPALMLLARRSSEHI